MITTVDAIYQNGKLVLPKPLPLPEKAHVRVTIESEQPLSDAERVAWLKFSEQSLMQTWDNRDDDIFNALLTK
jgi:predicted DNA-binding antitoxin AbrB/MazE fold protein